MAGGDFVIAAVLQSGAGQCVDGRTASAAGDHVPGFCRANEIQSAFADFCDDCPSHFKLGESLSSAAACVRCAYPAILAAGAADSAYSGWRGSFSTGDFCGV